MPDVKFFYYKTQYAVEKSRLLVNAPKKRSFISAQDDAKRNKPFRSQRSKAYEEPLQVPSKTLAKA